MSRGQSLAVRGSAFGCFSYTAASLCFFLSDGKFGPSGEVYCQSGFGLFFPAWCISVYTSHAAGAVSTSLMHVFPQGAPFPLCSSKRHRNRKECKRTLKFMERRRQ